MSIYARLRVLLALSVLVIGGSVWLIAGQQREAVIGMQGQLRASNDPLTAMLDQETGLRGYALTGDEEFLKPYLQGRDRFDRALASARSGPGREPATWELTRTLAETAREWQAIAAIAVDQVERRGPLALSLDGARRRKALTDRFHGENAALRRHVERRAQDRLQHARWLAFGFVMLFSTTILILGMGALERQARRDRVRSRERREYVEALQGALDEPEATDLEGALQCAENLRASFDGLNVPGVTAHVTASLGVATLLDQAGDGPALIRAADRALYAAKTAGRNRVAAAAPAGEAVS